jgi:hypothetical protein
MFNKVGLFKIKIMTIDKITHYIGKNIVEFIGSLNEKQLQQMKSNIITDMNLPQVKQDKEILFKRTIELEFINQRLN